MNIRYFKGLYRTEKVLFKIENDVFKLFAPTFHMTEISNAEYLVLRHKYKWNVVDLDEEWETWSRTHKDTGIRGIHERTDILF